MNKTYLYLGVGAVALIGIYMYMKNRSASNVSETPTNEGKSLSEGADESISETPKTLKTPAKPTTRDIRNIKLRPNRSTKPSTTSTSSSALNRSGITIPSGNSGVTIPSGVTPAMAQAMTTASQNVQAKIVQASGNTINCEVEAIKKFGVNWRTTPNSYIRQQNIAWFEKCMAGQLGGKENFVPFYSVEEETFAFNGHKF